MHKLTRLGRYMFAIALCGLGVEHFIFNKFITGRAPLWPEGIPGNLPWAYFTGAIFITLSFGMFIGKHARMACLLAGMLIFFWAFVRHIPEVLSSPLFAAPTWTQAGKSLTFFSGAFAIAAVFPKYAGNDLVSKVINRDHAFLLASRIGLGIFMIVCGRQHFMYTPFVASLIPDWFPGDPVSWTYFTGVTLIAGGIGLIIPYTAGISAFLSALMFFSWLIIVHIPKTFDSESSGIAVFEALAVSAIAFVIAGHRGLSISNGT